MATATAKKSQMRPLDDRVVRRAVRSSGDDARRHRAARQRPARSPAGHRRRPRPGQAARKTASAARCRSSKATRVFYGKYSGTEIEIDGETYVILRESDILAVEE
jgi:hypothetical protein